MRQLRTHPCLRERATRACFLRDEVPEELPPERGGFEPGQRPEKPEWASVDNSQVDYMCLVCKGELDGKNYLKPHTDHPEELVPTAEWIHESNKSKGHSNKKRAQFIVVSPGEQEGADRPQLHLRA